MAPPLKDVAIRWIYTLLTAMDLFTLYRKNLKQQAVYLAAISDSHINSAKADLFQFAQEHGHAAECLGRLLDMVGNIYLADFDAELVKKRIALLSATDKRLCHGGLNLVMNEITDLFG